MKFLEQAVPADRRRVRHYQKHPGDGHQILLQTPQIGPIPLDITLHHHERMDGSGLRTNSPGEQITTLAQMAAIVDVYDAITADRCYHKAWPPPMPYARF